MCVIHRLKLNHSYFRFDQKKKRKEKKTTAEGIPKRIKVAGVGRKLKNMMTEYDLPSY